MENRNKITPVGLKGKEINARMIELMGIKPINENHAKSVVELTKIGPDGNAYAIVRENHEYYIKTTNKKSNIITEDFNYIGGLQNKKSEAYPSYAKAIKQLNLKFNSLAESFDRGHNINVFENDNLISERAFGMGFSNEGNLEGNDDMYGEKGGISPLKVMKSRAGYYVGRSDSSDGFEVPYSRDSGYFATSEEAEAHLNRINMSEGKKENNPWAICTASVGRENKDKYEACVMDVKKQKGIEESMTENEYCGMDEEVELSEAEKAIEEMMARYDESNKAEWKSDFDGNKDFDEYGEDKLDFENEYGSIYDIVDNLDADISGFYNNAIFNELFNNELNTLTNFNLPKGQELNSEKIKFKSSPGNNTISARIYTLPNNKYGFYSDFDNAYLASNDKEKIIKLAAIDAKLMHVAHSDAVDKQTSRAESGWVDESEFPDLTGDGKVTRADILKGRGVDLDESIKRLDSLLEGELKKKALK